MTSLPVFRDKSQPFDSDVVYAPQPRVLVAFGGQAELPWLRLLRPGFRHCFAVVESPGDQTCGMTAVNDLADSPAPASRWTLYNPLSNGTQLEMWPPSPALDLGDALRQQGYIVVEIHARPLSTRLFAWRPYTCVEAVKRVIGVHAPGVFTPWQLYRFLKNTHNRKKILDCGE